MQTKIENITEIICYNLSAHKDEITSDTTFRDLYADTLDISCLCFILGQRYNTVLNPSYVSLGTKISAFINQIIITEDSALLVVA